MLPARHLLNRLGPPRVRLDHPLSGEPPRAPESSPFVLLVVVDLGATTVSSAQTLAERPMRAVTASSFDAWLADLTPTLHLEVEAAPADVGRRAFDLRCQRLADFEAEGLAVQVGEAAEAIRRHPAFLLTESAVRGLHQLVSRAPAGPSLEVRLLEATRAELEADLAPEGPAHLWRRLVEVPRRTPGEPLLGALVVDVASGLVPVPAADDRLGLIAGLARLGAGGRFPVIVEVADALCALSPPPPARRGRRPGSAPRLAVDTDAWRALRERPEARFLAPIAGRFLAREPVERTETPARTGAPWASGVYAWAECLLRAIGTHGWPAAIAGLESGGAIEDLLLASVRTDDLLDLVPLGPTLRPVTDAEETARACAGINSLVGRRSESAGRKALAVVFSGTTLAADRTVTAGHVATACHVVRALEAALRDATVSSATPEAWRDRCQAWLDALVGTDESDGAHAQARRPLFAAAVEVLPPALPGAASRLAVTLTGRFLLEGRIPVAFEFDLPDGGANAAGDDPVGVPARR
jgi:predicted component of type VI protein secretion system